MKKKKASSNEGSEVDGPKVKTDDMTGVAVYVGETSRSAFERGREHQADFRNKDKDSHMLKHKLIQHPDQEVTYSMKIMKKHRTCFARQILGLT